MEGLPKRTLIVVEDYPAHNSESALIRVAALWVSRRIVSWSMLRLKSSAEGILCSQEVHSILEAKASDRGTTIHAIAALRARDEVACDDIRELLDFNRRFIHVLEQEKGAWVDGMSIPAALAYGFSAAYSEDAPFLIVGALNLVRNYDSVVLLGDSAGGDIRGFLREAALSQNKEVVIQNFFWSMLFDWALRWAKKMKGYFKFMRSCLEWMATPCAAAPICSDSIWLVAQRPRSAMALSRIESLIAQQGKKACIVALPSVARHWHGESGPSPHAISSVLSRWDRIRLLLSVAWHFSIAFSNAKARMRALPERFEYRGVPLFDLLMPQIAEVARERGPFCSVLVRSIKRAFENGLQRGVVVLEPTEFSQIAIRVAQERSLPSLLYVPIDDGHHSTNSIWAEHLISPYIGTLNESQSRFFKSRLQGARIEVVGSLSMRCLLPRERLTQRTRVRQKLNLQEDAPLVLIGSRHVSRDLPLPAKRAYFELIARGLRETALQALVRCHPHEEVARTQRELAAWGIPWPVIGSETPFTFFDLSLAADVVCNVEASSSSMDALLAETPVILVNDRKDAGLSKIVTNATYAEAGAAVRVTHSDELKQEILRLIGELSYRAHRLARAKDFVERFNGPVDGAAGNRMAQLLALAFPVEVT